MIDDDPMTDQRRVALAKAHDARRNIDSVVDAFTAANGFTSEIVIALAAVQAQVAQVMATLDLADATREQTAALEAIDVGRRLGR